MLRRLIVSLASLLVFFALLEGGLRLAGFRHPPRKDQLIVWNAHEDVALRQRDGMFRHSARQLWEPRPGSQDSWDEGRTINAAGYRGPELPLEKTPGRLRVATLGDSSTFGMGVRYDESYSGQLPAALAAHGIDAEVLCGGVIGFTIRQGLERYDELIRPYDPDVVVCAFGAVNEHLPAVGGLPDEEKIGVNEAYRSEAARFYRRMRKQVRALHLFAWVGDRLQAESEEQRVARLREEKRLHELNKRVGEADWEGQRRVSLDEFTANLERLRQRVEADGATLVVVSMPRHPDCERDAPVLPLYNAAVRDFAGEHDVPLLSARGLIRKQLAQGATWEELFVDFYHPSPRGHALLADKLANVIARALAGSPGDGPAQGDGREPRAGSAPGDGTEDEADGANADGTPGGHPGPGQDEAGGEADGPPARDGR